MKCLLRQIKRNRRQLWRLGKSSKQKSKCTDTDTIKSMPQEFYSLGSSMNKTESISINSHLTSSIDIKPKQIKCKKQDTKCKINFSDRTLSSKLYSVKRKEIFLFQNGKTIKRKEKTSDEKTKYAKTIKKNVGCKSRYKVNRIEGKVTKKNYQMKKYFQKPKIRAKVDLSENSISLIKTVDRPKRTGKKLDTFLQTTTKTWVKRSRKKMTQSTCNYTSESNKNNDPVVKGINILFARF